MPHTLHAERHHRSLEQPCPEEEGGGTHMGPLTRPQGAPRGLLLYYILHRLAERPAHGYEILQDIESKTEGGWRPGPGSIYPMLKKLLADGLISTESARETETSQHVYRITERGTKHLQEAKQMFADMAKRWGSMRRIFVEMIDPKDIGSFFVDGTRVHFEISRETVGSKIASIPLSEARFMLKEYALNLERQMEWCNKLLEDLEQKQQQQQKPSATGRVAQPKSQEGTRYSLEQVSPGSSRARRL